MRDGIDPIEAKNEAREQAKAELSAKKVQAKAQAATLCRVARAYHERVIEGRLSTKHAAQWIASLENNVPAKIWHAPIDTVRGPDLLAVPSATRCQGEGPQVVGSGCTRSSAVWLATANGRPRASRSEPG
ncbi:MAG TPA: hypothetical protein VII31_12230, partial [Caldimonas sp.]